MNTSDLIVYVLLGSVCSFFSFVIGFLYRKFIGERKVRLAELRAKEILSEAEEDAKFRDTESKKKVEDRLGQLKLEFETSVRTTKEELEVRKRETEAHEATVDKKFEIIQTKEKEVSELSQTLNQEREVLNKTRSELDRLITNEREILQRVSGLSQEDAKRQLLRRMEADVRAEASRMIKVVESEAKPIAEKKASKILALAIQKCAAEHSIESTVSVVNLPSDEMKGRIIGKEGRNIRTFETTTGVDLVIDDTPGAVILSAFDPVRREIARITLERLIEDGRIHPSSIEEMVGKVRQEIDQAIREEGEKSITELGVGDVHPELIQLLGRLKFRTSFGQNVLAHSKEVAYLMSVIASEMGIDPVIAKRTGLLHDIGKAASHEVEGPHALVGGEFARRYGEPAEVVHGIEAHHEDIEQKDVLPVLVQAADAVSGARPGARRESLENYIKRLRRLEKTASTIMGVDKVFAIQAGREIRVMVHPEQVGDNEMPALAREVSKKVEQDLQYPGQIRVTVIRETRAVEIAR